MTAEVKLFLSGSVCSQTSRAGSARLAELREGGGTTSLSPGRPAPQLDWNLKDTLAARQLKLMWLCVRIVVTQVDVIRFLVVFCQLLPLPHFHPTR